MLLLRQRADQEESGGDEQTAPAVATKRALRFEGRSSSDSRVTGRGRAGGNGDDDDDDNDEDEGESAESEGQQHEET
jgi:hypothetical protein